MSKKFNFQWQQWSYVFQEEEFGRDGEEEDEEEEDEDEGMFKKSHANSLILQYLKMTW